MITRWCAAFGLALVGWLNAAPPASAQTCADSGVLVVVDFGQLGGGTVQQCVSQGAGSTAVELYGAAGVGLSYVQQSPGFVCQVAGKPADSACVVVPPANAYWGLFWARPAADSWSYASVGVTALEIPAGGSVALVWQASSGTRAPGVAPQSAAEPTVKPSPTPRATQTPTPSPTPSLEPTPTATSRPSAGRSSAVPTPDASPSAAPSGAETAGTSDSSNESQGLPVAVPLAVIVSLIAAGGLVAYRRRLRS